MVSNGHRTARCLLLRSLDQTWKFPGRWRAVLNGVFAVAGWRLRAAISAIDHPINDRDAAAAADNIAERYRKPDLPQRRRVRNLRTGQDAGQGSDTCWRPSARSRARQKPRSEMTMARTSPATSCAVENRSIPPSTPEHCTRTPRQTGAGGSPQFGLGAGDRSSRWRPERATRERSNIPDHMARAAAMTIGHRRSCCRRPPHRISQQLTAE